MKAVLLAAGHSEITTGPISNIEIRGIRLLDLQVSFLRNAGAEQIILVDLPILHDHKEILLRIGNQVDVGDWVAVDQQQIGESIYFNNAQLARIGVARAGEREQLRVLPRLLFWGNWDTVTNL